MLWSGASGACAIAAIVQLAMGVRTGSTDTANTGLLLVVIALQLALRPIPVARFERAPLRRRE